MRADNAQAQALPTWRQAALLSLVERAPALAGMAAVVALVDGNDALILAAIAVLVLVTLGSWLARRVAESMGVARRELGGLAWAAVAVLALAVVVLAVADAIPLVAAAAVLVAGVAVAEASATTVPSPSRP